MCINKHLHSPNIDFIKIYYFIFFVSITNLLQTIRVCDNPLNRQSPGWSYIPKNPLVLHCINYFEITIRLILLADLKSLLNNIYSAGHSSFVTLLLHHFQVLNLQMLILKSHLFHQLGSYLVIIRHVI